MVDGNSSAAYVHITGLSKRYPGQTQPAVDAVSLSVAQGEMLALLGPSGCGKTSTLRMIAGLIRPSAGRISIGGRDITRLPIHLRGLGMVFQSYALFPHFSVLRNVAFGLEMRKLPRRECEERARHALALVKLDGLEERRIGELSGGQQQRVALARALVIEPAVLLLDEPLSNLDAKLRDAMRTEIKEIQRRTGVTTIFVTHDQDEALSMADRVAVMRAGKVEQIGSATDIYQRPANRFVADFIGKANFLEARVSAHEAQGSVLDAGPFGRLAAHYAPENATAVYAMIRPHQIRLGPVGQTIEGSGVTGVVEDVSYTGNLVRYGVRVGEGDESALLIAEVFAEDRPGAVIGQCVSLAWRREDLAVLPA